MTAPQERPAGRPTSSARPAGAHGRGAPAIDPRTIRAALEHADRYTLLASAIRYGVAVRTLSRWRRRAAAARAAGGRWPTDADVTYWLVRQPIRKHRRNLDRARQGLPVSAPSQTTRRSA
ncbi:hypothetical protein [Blastococcus sp. CCUG 61487]|uniref:hypothetical protein n=1 Tax=Blastococcus sp. CCUG 61487 TaxID=1840703 RepID=UPI0010BFE45B|nr:hypothetical protein [Blastococcus sp. CCUG 61487]